MGIVCTGSIAFDDVSTGFGSVQNALGGSALYFTASASLFSPVILVSVVGNDFPLDAIRFLEERGVSFEALEIVQGGNTFKWGARYCDDMNRRTTLHLEKNIFERFSPILNERCRNADYFFLGSIDPEIQLSVINQAVSPRFIGADTIECYIREKPDVFKEVIKKVTMVLINDEEACFFTGEQTPIKAARALLAYGTDYVVVKKGRHGAMLVTRDELFVVPAYQLEDVVDPTGAGDSFAGGVMGYIARKNMVNFETVKTAVVYGGIAASFTVEDFSIDRLQLLTLADIEQRRAVFRSMTSW